MMTTTFMGVFTLVPSMGGRLARLLEESQLKHLTLLELAPDCLVTPYP
jgi:hypothetical protein